MREDVKRPGHVVTCLAISPPAMIVCIHSCLFAALAAAGGVPGSDGNLNTGAAVPPQWLAPTPEVWTCSDGFWGLEPGTVPNWGAFSQAEAIQTVVHEVRRSRSTHAHTCF